MFRLAANIAAGLVVITLISSILVSITITTIPIPIILSRLYLMFELGICLIQAYIFCLIISLYSNDHA